MTNADNPISAIEALLHERQRYEGWMATLDTRREITPPHVYERVRTDYEARLRDVLERLGGRSGDLRAMADTLAQRVAALEGDESTRRDALSEAELRALVGEYEPEEWERLKTERETEIQRIVGERDEVRGELDRVQELLSKADAEPRFATPAPGVATTPHPVARAVEEPEQEEPEPEPEPTFAAPEPEPEFQLRDESLPAASPSAPGRPAPAPVSFDELAFLQSLSDNREGRPTTPPSSLGGVPATGGGTGSQAAQSSSQTAPASQPARPASPAAEPGRTLADDLAVSSGFPAPPADAPARPPMRPTTSVTNPFGDPRVGQPSDARRASDSVPAFLRDVPSEQVKTLKCQECGTMNYPTEWYCERCGGELAAM